MCSSRRSLKGEAANMLGSRGTRLPSRVSGVGSIETERLELDVAYESLLRSCSCSISVRRNARIIIEAYSMERISRQ